MLRNSRIPQQPETPEVVRHRISLSHRQSAQRRHRSFARPAIEPPSSPTAFIAELFGVPKTCTQCRARKWSANTHGRHDGRALVRPTRHGPPAGPGLALATLDACVTIASRRRGEHAACSGGMDAETNRVCVHATASIHPSPLPIVGVTSVRRRHRRIDLHQIARQHPSTLARGKARCQ